MIRLIEPKLRFNKVISELRKDRINPDSEPVYPQDYDLPFEYLCSICDYKVSIKNQDLERHSKSSYSNLNRADRLAMEEFIKSKQLEAFSFIDFHCPKCNKPVRILFNYGAGGFYGMTFNLEYVLEIDKQ